MSHPGQTFRPAAVEHYLRGRAPDDPLVRAPRPSLARLFTALRAVPRVRTPIVLQAQMTECGLAAIGIVLAHHGRALPPERLRELVGVSRDGSNVRQLLDAIRELGLQASARKVLDLERLRELPMPCVAHVNFNHFVVLEGASDDGVAVNDPGGGPVEWTWTELDEAFTGIVITVQPTSALPTSTEALPAEGRSRVRSHAPSLAAHFRELVGLGPMAPALLWGAAEGSLLVVLAVLAAQGRAAYGSTALPLAGSALLVALGSLLLLRARATARQRARLATRWARTTVRRFLQERFAFFVYRTAGSLASGVRSARQLADLVTGYLELLVRSAMGLAVVLGGMLAIAPVAGSLAAIGVVLALIRAFHLERRIGTTRGRFPGGTEVAVLRRLEPVLVGGRPDEVLSSRLGRDAWKRSRTRRTITLEARLAALRAGARWWPVGATLLGLAVAPGSAVVVLLLAAAAGMLMRPLLELAGQLDRLLAALSVRADLNPLPVPRALERQPAESEAHPPRPPGAGANPAAADATLAAVEVTFGYSLTREPILRGVSVAFRKGLYGVTGSSGCGKSTLAGVLAGLHEPWSGTILLDGEPLAADRHGAHRSAIGWVDSRPYLPEGSVADMLRLVAPDASDERLRDALEVACVADAVRARGGLEARIGPDGAGWSGGEGQRLELARALLRNPRVLLLDEANDALEPDLEEELLTRLRTRVGTIVVITHRSETLSRCDEVIVLDAGTVDVHAARGQEVTMQVLLQRSRAPTAELEGAGASHGENPREALERVGAELLEQRELARRAGKRVRPVHPREPGWWREDIGELIVVLDERRLRLVPSAEGMRPQALLQPALEAPAEPLDERTASAYSRCYELYERLPDKVRTPRALLGQAAKAGARELRPGLVREAASYAALLALLPCAAWLIFGGLPLLGLAVGGFALTGALTVRTLWAWRWRRLTDAAEHRLEALLWDRILRLPAPTFEQHPSWGARLGVPAELWRRGTELLGAGLADGLLVVSGLAVLAAVDARLAGLAFGALLVGAGVVLWLARSEHGLRARVRFARERAKTELAARLAGLPRLRALDADRRALRSWSARHERMALRAERRLAQREAVADTILRAGALAGPATLAIMAEWRFPGGLSAGEGALVVVAAALLLTGAEAGVQALAALLRCRAIESDLRPLIAATPDLPARPEGRQPLDPGAPIVELRGVSFGYEVTAPLLDGIDLTLRPGEVLGVTGPSGCGKSTLLDLLLGFLNPSAGEIRFAGVLRGEVDLESWRAEAGAVLQGESLPDTLLRGAVTGGEPFSDAEIWGALDQCGMASDVRAMPRQLETFVGEGAISTGQRQRLLIARELLRRPRVLFLDEATSALDPSVEGILFEKLRSAGIAVVAVAHRESTLRHADRVLTLGREH